MKRNTKGIIAAMTTAIAAVGHYAQPFTTEVATAAGQTTGMAVVDKGR